MGFFACGLETDTIAGRPAVEWEQQPCPLCNSECASVLLEAADAAPGASGLWFPVAQCQDCGLCYTNPRPSENTIGQFYQENYPPHCKIAKAHKRSPGAWWRLWRNARIDPFEKEPVHGQGRLLDFGCGNGAFLERMKAQGWIVTGIDASASAVQRLRQERGLRAVVGSLPHPELGDNSFDVITMRHSLEHVHRPLEVLRAAHRLLEPGGLLVVSTPNIDSLPYKWFGRHWWGLDLPRHLTHFTPDTLQLMLARAGFDVFVVRRVPHTNWLRRWAAQAAATLAVPHWQRWLRGRFCASVAMWYAWFARRCDGMLVKAVKSDLPQLELVPAVSHEARQRQRPSADRWRSR
jgi:2-polyprenyl-3-methyl-5-hydroxy-6-metoxy-1,4-benzoquinol methylase